MSVMSRRAFLVCSGALMAAPKCVSQQTSTDTSSNRRLNPWRLEAVDLRRFMRLGVDHIYHGAVDAKREYLPFVRFVMTKSPTLCNHEYWGSPHMEGRFLDALAQCSEIIDMPADEKVVDGLRNLVHRSLDNPWHLPFWTFGDQDGKKTANLHDCREVLLGLVGLAKWKKCERSVELAKDMVVAMEKATRETGTYPSYLLGADGWLPPEPGFINYTCGRAVGALTAYYRLSNDQLALDLARRFADYVMLNAFTPEGELSDGAGSHLHSSTGTMASLLDLGALLEEARYLEFGRKAYEVGLKPWRTSFGWAKETRNLFPQRGEANNTGDYIEAALTLARNVDGKYFADAERFIRNGLLAAQIVCTDWIEQSDVPDTENDIHSRIRERARGGFSFTAPNGYDSYNTDLMGGALRALCKAWHTSLREEADVCHVDMLFPVETPSISTSSEIPQAGRYEIRVKKPCTLNLRLMENVTPESVRMNTNGATSRPAVENGVITCAGVSSGTIVTLTFDLPAYHTQEKPPGWDPVEVDWRGNTIVAMQPSQGPISLY